MIDDVTVWNAWQEMGRDMSDANTEKKFWEFIRRLQDEACDLSTDYFFAMQDDYLKSHSFAELADSFLPEEFQMRAYTRAIEEVMDENVHQPLYAYYRENKLGPYADDPDEFDPDGLLDVNWEYDY